jgi:hypothetical protein
MYKLRRQRGEKARSDEAEYVCYKSGRAKRMGKGNDSM